MLPEQQQRLISRIQAAVAHVVPQAEATVQLERPKVAAHGDVATNVAMQLAKPARQPWAEGQATAYRGNVFLCCRTARPLMDIGAGTTAQDSTMHPRRRPAPSPCRLPRKPLS